MRKEHHILGEIKVSTDLKEIYSARPLGRLLKGDVQRSIPELIGAPIDRIIVFIQRVVSECWIKIKLIRMH